MGTKKRFNKIINSPAIGLLSLMALNAAVVYFVINISRYITIKRDVFIYVLLGLVGIILVANLMFAIGYGLRYKWARKLYLILSMVLILVIGMGASYVYKLNKATDAFINKDIKETTEYSFITINEGQSLDNLFPETRLGYVGQDDHYNETVVKEIAKHSSQVDTVVYESYHDLFHDLLNRRDLDVAVVPKQFTRYVENFEEDAQELLFDAVVLRTFDITSSVDIDNTANVLKEPFTVLMMGLNDNLADSIMLITVNPQTLHITMTSVGRDMYVPIACYSGNRPDKINHSRGRSRQCMIDTVEDLFEIDIDFYFETDFFALIKVVDAIGGLELDVPIEFGRMLPVDGKPGEREWIKVPKGRNLLNGKQVVNFTRERKSFPNGDFQRQLNQQYVLKELGLKIVDESKKNINNFVKVLKAAESNISMNFSVDNDLSPLIGYMLNNIAASPVDPFSTFVIQNSQVTGITPMVNGMSVVVPYSRSLADNKAIIHNNLSTEIKEPSKQRFVFNANNPFEFAIKTHSSKYYGSEVAWPIKPPSDATETPVTPPVVEPGAKFSVPNMTDGTMDVAAVQAWAKTNGIQLNIRKITKENQNLDQYNDQQIINQTVAPGLYNTKPETVTISVVYKDLEHDVKPPVDETKPPVVPKFKTYYEAKKWADANNVPIKYNIEVVIEEIEEYIYLDRTVEYDANNKIVSITLIMKRKA